MARILYLIRHCQAEGQAPDPPLTPAGHDDAIRLADFLRGAGIQRVVSSPHQRAIQTAEPLARRLGLAVETDPRLAERVLAGADRPDWRERLRESFADPDLCLPGGESGRAALERGLAALRDLTESQAGPAAAVTHGNLLALLLQHFDPRHGFDTWQALTNPDLYRITIVPEGARVERIWTDPPRT